MMCRAAATLGVARPDEDRQPLSVSQTQFGEQADAVGLPFRTLGERGPRDRCAILNQREPVGLHAIEADKQLGILRGGRQDLRGKGHGHPFGLGGGTCEPPASSGSAQQGALERGFVVVGVIDHR